MNMVRVVQARPLSSVPPFFVRPPKISSHWASFPALTPALPSRCPHGWGRAVWCPASIARSPGPRSLRRGPVTCRRDWPALSDCPRLLLSLPGPHPAHQGPACAAGGTFRTWRFSTFSLNVFLLSSGSGGTALRTRLGQDARRPCLGHFPLGAAPAAGLTGGGVSVAP